jgi:hypothetical protein
VAEFLSDEWISALADCSAGTLAEDDTGGRRLVVEPVVVGVPGRGVVRYLISFGTTGCTVGAAAPGAPDPDVHLETDYATAVVLARGEANAQVALADGRLRVSGDVVRLAAHAAALARLDDLFSAVRATTTYPEPGERGRDEQS